VANVNLCHMEREKWNEVLDFTFYYAVLICFENVEGIRGFGKTKEKEGRRGSDIEIISLYTDLQSQKIGECDLP